ncbi:hypothetical protein [Streptomyces sp. NPDC007905]|uniref:hypothetical protein n=1 Tax=Streptomyces sp. NPDC007905 TaxID=3364788 RepID=UPI0036E6A1A5
MLPPSHPSTFPRPGLQVPGLVRPRLGAPALDWLTAALAATAAVTVLRAPRVRRIFGCVVEPRTDWAFRRTPIGDSRSGSAVRSV